LYILIASLDFIVAITLSPRVSIDSFARHGCDVCAGREGFAERKVEQRTNRYEGRHFSKATGVAVAQARIGRSSETGDRSI
jgi:hypothetical protein